MKKPYQHISSGEKGDLSGRPLQSGDLRAGLRRCMLLISLAGAARREIRTSHRVVGGDTLAAPAFSTSGHRPGTGVFISRIASVQSGVIFHNFEFRLEICPTSGCVSIWAAGLRPSHPLTSVSATEPNFSCNRSFPSPERWTSASTAPGAGFLEFTSSADGGAFEIRTGAASTLNSSSVKLRHIPASVHFASPACLAATVLQTSPTCRNRQRLLPGPGIHFIGRAAWPYKSGKLHILIQRRPVLLFYHNPKLFLAYSSSNPKPAPREHRRNQNQIRDGSKRLMTFSPFSIVERLFAVLSLQTAFRFYSQPNTYCYE